MKNTQTLLLASAGLIFACQSVHAATIISQTANGANASSGAGNYGQAFQVRSSLTDKLLSSFTLTKGANNGGDAETWIDVYTIGTAVFNDLNFGNTTEAETGNLNFLGSSTSFVDTTAANGITLTWNFANIDLSGFTDEVIFLVFSDDSGASTANFVGTSVRVEGSPGVSDYNNIDGGESHTLAFAGDVQTAEGSTTDNRYSITLVPEPSAALLSGLGLLALLRRRRA